MSDTTLPLRNHPKPREPQCALHPRSRAALEALCDSGQRSDTSQKAHLAHLPTNQQRPAGTPSGDASTLGSRVQNPTPSSLDPKTMCVQVRDAACLACGQYVLAYPEEARGTLDQLYVLWFDHLCENIPSVRAGAAAALANAVRAYGDGALSTVLQQLR